MFDAASRYLLFPLKREVADVILPQLEMFSPAKLCHWLLLSDMYDPFILLFHFHSVYCRFYCIVCVMFLLSSTNTLH